MSGDIPKWAIERACQLMGWKDFAQMKRSHSGPKAMLPKAAFAFASYIAEHEEPPVDPLLIEARELVATDNVTWSTNQVAAIRAGTAGIVQVALVQRALRRGMELASKNGEG